MIKIYICIIIDFFMRKNTAILLFASLAMVSCRTSAPLKVSEVKYEKNAPVTSKINEDKAINAVIAPYKSKLEGVMNTKISHTAKELNKTGDNSPLGNLLADYTLEGAESWGLKNGISKIDAAVVNIGGIRNIIPAGDIITKQIYEVMPFENELVIVKLKGSDLQGLYDSYAKTEKNNPVSKIQIETLNHQLVKQLIDGKAIEPNKIYTIATSDYLALGGDNMSFFSKGEMISTGLKLREVYLGKFKNNPEIVAPTDIRLVFKK